MPKTPSGKSWVAWADAHAKNSDKVEDLAEPFRAHLKAFVKALTEAGAKVKVTATRRDAKRAYLFHWAWLIGLGKATAAEAKPLAGVDIEWDHGHPDASKAGAKEMIHGFGLAVPPHSTVAPALASNHIAGNAIDMDITWVGELKVKKKDGTVAAVPFMANPNHNAKLHAVGESYSVHKHKTDAPHWSINGR